MKEILLDIHCNIAPRIRTGCAERVLGYCGYRARDDMTVLVAGVWKKSIGVAMREKILEFMKKNKMAEPGDVLCVGFSAARILCACCCCWRSFPGACLPAAGGACEPWAAGAGERWRSGVCRKILQRAGDTALCLCVPGGADGSGKPYGTGRGWPCGTTAGVRRVCKGKWGNQNCPGSSSERSGGNGSVSSGTGSSLRGLSSIRPVNGRIIRPLLCVTRREIEQYLKNLGIAWRTDSSNLSVDYTRNIIRHNVIPCLEEQVNERAVLLIAEAAGDLAEADEFCGGRQKCVWADRKENGKKWQRCLAADRGADGKSREFCRDISYWHAGRS